MSKPPLTQPWTAEYERLRARLGQTGWIALGTLIERGLPGQGGPRYQWSRRAGGKTVTVALSIEQFEWMKKAIANQRKVWDDLFVTERTATDPKVRAAAFKKLQDLWIDDVPIIPLWQGDLFIFTKKNVGGVQTNASMLLLYNQLTLK